MSQHEEKNDSEERRQLRQMAGRYKTERDLAEGKLAELRAENDRLREAVVDYAARNDALVMLSQGSVLLSTFDTSSFTQQRALDASRAERTETALAAAEARLRTLALAAPAMRHVVECYKQDALPVALDIAVFEDACAKLGLGGQSRDDVDAPQPGRTRYRVSMDVDLSDKVRENIDAWIYDVFGVSADGTSKEQTDFIPGTLVVYSIDQCAKPSPRSSAEKLDLAGELLAREQALAEAEATIERTWREIGVSEEDRRENDDPEVATLDASVRVALRYERDRVEAAEDRWDALAVVLARACALLEKYRLRASRTASASMECSGCRTNTYLSDALQGRTSPCRPDCEVAAILESQEARDAAARSEVLSARGTTGDAARRAETSRASVDHLAEQQRLLAVCRCGHKRSVHGGLRFSCHHRDQGGCSCDGFCRVAASETQTQTYRDPAPMVEPAPPASSYAAPASYTEPRRYRSDDRDLDPRDDNDLLLFMGGNGDWYVSVVEHGKKLGPCVRVTTSGTPRGLEGVPRAVHALYLAMKEER